MSGMAYTPQRGGHMAVTVPYTSSTLGFVVKDHRREDFNRLEAVRSLKAPRIGVPNVPYYLDAMKRMLPQATIVPINSVRKFLEELGEDLDALAFSAEAGSAWSLLYPDYTVVIPQPLVLDHKPHGLRHIGLEFVPLERAKLAAQLNAGYCDIIMSGMAYTPQRGGHMAVTVPYTSSTLGFVVKDHRREDFNRLEAVRSLKAPRIGVPNVPYYLDAMKRMLPQATIVPINSVRKFLEELGEDLDALAFSAEAGSAWSLLYPDYTVVIPQPLVQAVPMVYAVASDDVRMLNFVNSWIELATATSS